MTSPWRTGFWDVISCPEVSVTCAEGAPMLPLRPRDPAGGRVGQAEGIQALVTDPEDSRVADSARIDADQAGPAKHVVVVVVSHAVPNQHDAGAEPRPWAIYPEVVGHNEVDLCRTHVQ